MRIHLKKRFTALMLAGMMVTSNVLPAYSATDGIAVEQADASYEADAAAADASVDAENSEAGGASSEQGDAEKPVTDGTATEESKSDAANGTATEESKADAANGTATEESKADATNGAETEESKSDAGHGTGAEESKADAVHGSNAGGSSVVGAGSVDIDESTGAAVEIEETKPAELLEEETKLATESEIPKEEDEKKLEEKENRKTIYIAFGKGVKVTATLEDANAVPDDARLRVTEIDDDEMYAAYLEAMDEAEPEIKHTKKNTVLRDISFIMKDEDGKEIEYEPTEGSVKITIEYLENHLQDWFGVEDAAEVKTYHLPLAEGVKAEGEKTIDVQNVKASDINVQELDSEVTTEKTVEVEVDSFSMFAMARRRFVKASGNTSTDLLDFLTDITIDGISKNSDGSYTIKADTDYKFKLHFAEQDHHGGLQFDDNESLTYTLPSGFETLPTSKQGTCDIELLHEGTKYIIHNNTWKIFGRTLTFNWNQLDQNFEKLTSAANTEFYIELSGKAQKGESELSWSAGTDITVKVDNKSSVKVTKSGNLDLANKKINYEINVKSDGHNTNVEVRDEITGTALKYNNDAVLTSNKVNEVQTTASSADDYGFSYTIPEMQNGEVITIKYSASIDKSKITGNGTVEETNNGVTVKSTEDSDEKKDSKDFHNKINYTPKLDKTSGVQGAVTNGYTIIPYTITYNEDRNVSVAGNTITDIIGEESKARMTYDGPVTIEVYDCSNNKVETRTLTPESGATTWSYDIPPEDTENYKYVFKYNAKVNVKDLVVKPVTVKNKVSDGTTDKEISTEVKPDPKETAGVEKEAIKVNSKQIVWKITVHVPASGLKTAKIIDTLPNAWINGGLYLDQLEREDIQIENSKSADDGNPNITTEEDGKKIVIDYPNGLKGTGKRRDINITLTTKVNQDWLDLAEKDNVDWLKEHKNNVSFIANDVEFTKEEKAYPTKATVKKNGWKQEDKDGLPLYKYEVVVGGVTEKEFDIKDVFPTDYLKHYNKKGYEAKVTGGDQYNQYNECKGSEVKVSDTADGMNIHVVLAEDPSKYGYYKICYYLLAKKDLKDATLKNDDKKITLTNTAKFGEASSSVNITYSYVPLEKKLLNNDIHSTHIGTYEITVNPGAQKINNGNTYILTDTFENLSVDYSSVNVVTQPSGKKVEFNFDNKQGKFTIPDETSVVITYKARVVGTGNVNIKNTARIFGQDKLVDNWVQVDSSSGGTASTYSLKLLKYEKGHLENKLSGAKFALYIKIEDGNWEQLTEDIVTDENGEATIRGNGIWTLYPNTEYKIEEVQAPEGYVKDETPYLFKLTKDGQPDHDSHIYVNGDVLNFANEKIPESPKTTNVEVKKTWNDVGHESERPDKITVNLLADGVKIQSHEVKASEGWSYKFEGLNKYKKDGSEIVYTVTEEKVTNYTSEVNGYEINNTYAPDKTSVEVKKTWSDAGHESERPDKITVNLFADGSKIKSQEVKASEGWSYKFEGLNKYKKDGSEIVYTVTEEKVTNYTSEVNGYEINNTYAPDKTSVEVKKTWSDAGHESERPDKITVNLFADGSKIKSQEVKASEGWSYKFEDLNKYKKDGSEIVYTVTEEKVTNYTSEVNGYEINNTYAPDKTSVEVKKTWSDAGHESERPDKITVNLFADGSKIKSQEVKASEGWSYKFEDLNKYKKDGSEIVYTVTEEKVTNYTSEVNGYEINNTYAPDKTSVEVKKTWSDAGHESERPDKITVNLFADGSKIKSQEVKASEGWSYKFEDLNKYKKDGSEIVYTVTEEKVTNYTSEVNGYEINNTYAPDKTSVEVKKTWSDAGHESERPDKITVNLFADGSKIKSQEVKASEGWSYKFEGLNKYKKDGSEINYTVTEEEIPGYVLTDSKSSTEEGKTVVQLTNKSIDFKVNKFERTGTRELDGAKIQIKDSTGAVVAEWISKSGETHDFGSSLKASETYTIHEETAPSGYYTISDVNFTVDAKGQITLAGSSDDVKLEDGVIKICDERIKSSGGGGGGDHPHPLPETTPAETTPAETTVPETTPVETTNPGGGHGGPSEEVETDEYGRVRGANRNKNKNGQDGGNVKGASRGKTRTGDESMMSIFGFGFLAAVLVLLGWFGIRFTKRNRR